MAAGLARGRSAKTESKEPAYAVGAEIQRRFLSAYGTLDCRDLTGCDLATPEGQALFKAKDQEHSCCGYLALAVRSVVELAGKP